MHIQVLDAAVGALTNQGLSMLFLRYVYSTKIGGEMVREMYDTEGFQMQGADYASSSGKNNSAKQAGKR